MAGDLATIRADKKDVLETMQSRSVIRALEKIEERITKKYLESKLLNDLLARLDDLHLQTNIINDATGNYKT